jgi:phosphatidate phosphatase APP1
MARTPKALQGGVVAEPIMHLAARAEDALHAFREQRARKRGLTPTVIPYTGYGAPGWIRVLCRVLLTKPDLTKADFAAHQPGASASAEEPRYKKIRGWRSFTSVPVNDIAVNVTVNGVTRSVVADRGGVVDAVIEVHLQPGWHDISIQAEDSQPVIAKIFIVDPAISVGLISDVDDTVMVTALPRPFLAAWNTFVLDEHARRPVPGMSVLYERLVRQHPGCPVFYLSTGAWNVAPTLTRFLGRNMYPPGPLLLTDWGPTHDRWFRSGRLHKQETLRRLAAEFPGIQWLLVGDDGQHDEELYNTFAKSHPQNVKAVAIRQLSNSEAVLAGGRAKGDEKPARNVPWVEAPNGAVLADRLGELGLLKP